MPSLGGIGVGVISWAHRFLPDGSDEEEREPIASSEETVEAFDAELEAGEEEIGRRRLLVRLLAGAARRPGARGAVPDPLARSAAGRRPEGHARSRPATAS